MQALHKDVCNALEGVESIHTTSKAATVKTHQFTLCIVLSAMSKQIYTYVLSREGMEIVAWSAILRSIGSNSAQTACSSLSCFPDLILQT